MNCAKPITTFEIGKQSFTVIALYPLNESILKSTNCIHFCISAPLSKMTESVLTYLEQNIANKVMEPTYSTDSAVSSCYSNIYQNICSSSHSPITLELLRLYL